MDNMLQALLNWQFVFFALSISAIAFVFKKVVEFAFDSPDIPTGNVTKENKFWNKLFLPVSPIVLGAAMGFFATLYPFPEGIVSVSARMTFGMVAGLLSGFIYRVVKGTLSSKLASLVGVTPEANSEDPGAPARNIDNKE